MIDGVVHPGYIVAAALVAGGVTFLLRALPFVLLRPLRESRLVARLAVWMPAGILTILAVVMVLDSAALAPGDPVDWPRVGCTLAAGAVTVLVHLLGGRRTLLSIGAGTLAYVLLVNLAL
ncbi:AzlD domain-containing protein [Micrococcus porci]|uniref:branched-chain amino acid transporter permease n=1 Tax=Micrococcus TaxID=1269 RepID=UPI001CCFCE24|nr:MULTISPECIES: AzlD domain-containing protein [Micrococcus]MCG7422382.1 AzlD domain-containing protein [Micrococcus sp. ACRRV]UBH24128.1 AzlD domain-containing protein [Micrococcus porci]